MSDDDDDDITPAMIAVITATNNVAHLGIRFISPITS
jgi:hypothetical protein